MKNEKNQKGNNEESFASLLGEGALEILLATLLFAIGFGIVSALGGNAWTFDGYLLILIGILAVAMAVAFIGLFIRKKKASPSKFAEPPLEPMADFFAARVDGYDEHMLTSVEGCKNGYARMAELLPESTKRLLDLGCGTGLELDAILPRFPELAVTGIDLSDAMLDKLREKDASRDLTLVCGDYFTIPFGEGCFDAAVSFETMHHFEKEDKAALYKKIYTALTDGGVYIECDYMVTTQDAEDYFFAENARRRESQGITDGYYHFDTPCTVDNQKALLAAAGFLSVCEVFREGNTVMLLARKRNE